MPMDQAITFFTLPKGFDGETGIRQRAALHSWRAAVPASEILVMGSENGLDEASREVLAMRVSDIARNAKGTPLVSDAFRRASVEARNDLLCYINSDILLFEDFSPAVAAVARSTDGPFLLTGRRWNFDRADSDNSIDRDEILRRGTRYDEFNMDYFVFRRGGFAELPPFAVGRPGWDNWLVYEARRRGIHVIDATTAIVAGHQNHDYRHTSEGREGGKSALWSGAEASENRELAGGHLFDLTDASHVLTEALEVCPRRDTAHWWRRRTVAHEIYPRWSWFLRPLADADGFLRRVDHAMRLWFLRRGVDLFPHKQKRSGGASA
jgi:hypothetical protein